MVKFMSFSSGSCGNCYYLGDGRKGILIDAGVSVRRLKRALEGSGMSFNSFSAILVTHDHLDHIRHLSAYCKKLMKRVYTTSVLHEALLRHSFTSRIIGSYSSVLEDSAYNDIDGIKVRCFEVPHDATQTVGYSIELEGHRFVIMTDIGHMTDEAVSFASEADTVVIESNYDLDMLMGGPYTHELKMRIVKGNGHLSNDECASAVRRFMHPGLRNIFLCHLSENNNTHQKAYDCTFASVKDVCNASGNPVPVLRCLPRRHASPLFTL